MKNKIPVSDLDYVEVYARHLKIDLSSFKQQKELIESQMQSSKELTSLRFSKDNFKNEVRKHLKDIGIMKAV